MENEAKKRLVEERRDLQGRINKLERFITRNKIFKTLHRKEQKRQKKQLRLMKRLYDVLTERLVNWK